MRLYYYRPKRPLFWNLKRNQRGYALVSVAMVGMLMLLVTMMIVFRSQSAQAIARAQLLKQQSVVLAEAAAVTYQSFLAQFPDIATQKRDDWGEFAKGVASDCALLSIYRPEEIQQISELAKIGTSWQAVNPDNPAQGQIRLVDYQYVPDPGVTATHSPGTATLRVEGRSRAKGVAAEAFGFGTSKSQLELRFRVDPKPPEELPVGIVGGTFTATTNPYGKPQISSNVCAVGTAGGANTLQQYLVKLDNGDPSKIAYSENFVANAPKEGARPLEGIEVSNLGNFAIYSNQVCQLPMLGNPKTTDGLPQGCPLFLVEMPSNLFSGDRLVYKYNLSQLDIGGEDLSVSRIAASLQLGTTTTTTATTGNGRLVLGRTGNEDIHLYIGGNTNLLQSRITVTPGTRVFLYLHGSLTASGGVPEGFLENTQSPENLQVYMYGDGSGTPPQLNLEYGHAKVNGFIFAPTADVSLIDMSIDGALWANKVSIVGDSKITQNVADPNLLKIIVPGRHRINPAFSWQQKEAT